KRGEAHATLKQLAPHALVQAAERGKQRVQSLVHGRRLALRRRAHELRETHGPRDARRPSAAARYLPERVRVRDVRFERQVRESRRAPKRTRVRTEAARRERARPARGLAREHHALCAQGRAPPSSFRREVPEDRAADAPADAPPLVRGQRFEVALEEREQRLVRVRVERVVEEETRRVLVARGRSAEPIPEELTMFARVLGADENLAGAEVNRARPLAPREPARNGADRP